MVDFDLEKEDPKYIYTLKLALGEIKKEWNCKCTIMIKENLREQKE